MILMRKTPGLIGLIAASFVASANAAEGGWPQYAGEAGGDRYSALDQINRGNVAGLEVAWSYRSSRVRLLTGLSR